MSPLTHGPVPRRLLGLTGPAALGLLSVSALHLVDTLFVARLGTGALAAMGVVMPVVLVFGGLGSGLATAATVRVARALGRGDAEAARGLTRAALGLAAAVGAAGACLALPVVRLWLHAEDPVARGAAAYLQAWLPGLPVLLVAMTGGGLLRAGGDTRTPARALAVAAGVNAALDPLLIGSLGLAGAAIASLAARVGSLGLLIGALAAAGRLARPSRPRTRRARLRELGRTALPAALAQLLLPATTAGVTAALAAQGPAAVAAFSAASRVEGLALLPLMGLGTAMAPFVGQNLGAGRDDRVRAAWAAGLGASALAGPVLWGLLALLAPRLAEALGLPPATRADFVLQLRLLPAGFAFQGVLMSAGPTLNALGRPAAATALTLLRGPILTLPLALAGAHLFGGPGLLGAMALANVLAGLAALPWVWARLPPPGEGARGPGRRYKPGPWTRSSWWERAGWAPASRSPWPVGAVPWSASGAGTPREPPGPGR